MIPLGAVFVHEGAERRMQWRKAERPEASKHSAIQCSPGSSPSSVLHKKATGKASIVVGSPSLGTTPHNIDLVADLSLGAWRSV